MRINELMRPSLFTMRKGDCPPVTLNTHELIHTRSEVPQSSFREKADMEKTHTNEA